MRLSLLALAVTASSLVALGCMRSEAAPIGPASPLADDAAVPARMETAVFAGGCFWSMERVFDGQRGVQRAVTGFSGGTTVNPSYESTFTNPAGQLESVQVVFDPAVVSYASLVRLFWHNVDPTTNDRQFCDQGPTYRAAIFAQNAAQRRTADASIAEVRARLSQPVVATVRDAAPFYPAEAYHQDYARRNPERYAQYRRGCRRDARLHDVWGDAAETAGSRI